MGRDGRLYKTIAISPSDKRLSRADLPPAKLKRWGHRQKAIVVLAVEAGLLSLKAACERYQMSAEEFLCWERTLAEHGVNGLKAGFMDRRTHNDKPVLTRATRDKAATPHQHRPWDTE